MSDSWTILQTIISGALTGGASATTTFLAVFKDIKKRLTDLEAKVGTAEPKTGLFQALEALAEQVRRLRREIDGWHDDPPDWARGPARRGTSINMEVVHEIEERMEQRLKSFAAAMKRLEDDLERREKRMEDGLERSTPGVRTFISRDEYEADSKQRAIEVAKIRENLASANSFLRGVMSALGYIGAENQQETPSQKPVGLLVPPPKRK